MDTSTLRKLVWEEMLCASMRANYFAELVRQYQRWDKWLRVGVLVASSGAVATALPQLHPGWKLAAPIVATAGSFWLLVSQYSTLARDAADLHSGWSGLARDYEKLWNNLSDSNTEAAFNRLYDCGETLGKAGTKFPYKANRLNHWLDHASELASSRYA